MDFGGDLSVLEPAMLFQFLNISGLTGVIKFISSSNVASFYFKKGELLYASIDTGRKKIGQVLIAKNYISQGQLDEALRTFVSRGGCVRIGQILIDSGYLERDVLEGAIKDQMKEAVYKVLSWDSGHFIFIKGVQPDNEDILLDIKLGYLILEGLKRLDESRSE